MDKKIELVKSTLRNIPKRKDASYCCEAADTVDIKKMAAECKKK